MKGTNVLAAARSAAEMEAIKHARHARRLEKQARRAVAINKRDPSCKRFKMVLSYEGSTFHGWQKQHPPGQAPLRTVEGVLEEHLRPVVAQRVKFFPSGRTDAGVSASGQVAQFDAILPDEALPGLADSFNMALPGQMISKRTIRYFLLID